MLISLIVVNEAGVSVFEYHTEIHPLRLIILAESRKAEARTQGKAWAAGNIRFYGKRFVDACYSSREVNPDLQTEAADVVMALWLHQTLFMSVSTKTFTQADLELRISPNGAVQSTRHPSNSF